MSGLSENISRSGGGRTPWISRRYTPYNRATATRILRRAKQTAAGLQPTTGHRRNLSENVTDGNKSLKELVKKTWHVYRVSPLYKFSHNPADLKHYSRVLSGHLEAEYNKGLAIFAENGKANMAVFSIFKGLQKSNVEPEAIKIELKQKPKTDGSKAHTISMAVLCSVDAGEESHEKVKPPFVLLPVMLFKGPIFLGKCLVKWLECQFDCMIHQAFFPPLAMNWMVAMWSGTVIERSANPVMLQFQVPPEVEGLHHITLTINSQDCKLLWECIHNQENEAFEKEEVVTFIKALQTHFYHHFKVKIDAMPLCKIGTAIAAADCSGKIKILSVDHIHQVLGLVTDVILETSIR